MNTKKCSKCKRVRLFSEFYNDKRASDGLYSWCKACLAANYVKVKKEKLVYQEGYMASQRNPCIYVVRLGGKKRYIGSTVYPEARKSQHLFNLRHNLSPRDRLDDFTKSGETAFDFRILLHGTEQEMANLEQLLILTLPPDELYNRYARKKGIK